MSADDYSARRSHDASPFARGLRYRWSLVLAVTLLGAAAGVWLVTAIQSSYSATASLQVGPGLVGAGSGGLAAPVNTQTEAQVARSTSVLERVAAALASPAGPDELRDDLVVGTPADADVLTLTFHAGTREGAATGANAAARAYLDLRTERFQQRLTAALATVTEQQRVVRVGLEESPEGVELATLQAQSASLAAQAGQLSSITPEPGFVLSQAEPPRSSDGLPAGLLIAAAAAVGLLLGWTLAAVRERVASPIRRESDLRAAGVPTLGTWFASESAGSNLAGAVRLRALAHDWELDRLVVVGHSQKAAEEVAASVVEALGRVRLGNTNGRSRAGGAAADAPGAGAMPVVATSPIGRPPMSLLAAARAPGVLLVPRKGRTRLDLVREFLDELDGMPVVVIGGVLV